MNTKTKQPEISAKRLSTIAIALGGGALFTLSLQGFLSFALVGKAETAAPVKDALSSSIPVDSFLNISLEASAAYVLDLTTGKPLYAKNGNGKLPLASITKIMTALVTRERISFGTVVTLTKNDLAAEGDTGLRPGERWRMGDLLDVMLLVSSNDAAHAVAGFVGSDGQSDYEGGASAARANFVGMMNKKALALGFNTMEFFNESGLDLSEIQNGGYGSAREVALLLSELWEKYPTAIEITAQKDAEIYSQDKIVHILQNTNEATGRFPGLIGSKTGYTTLAGGNLAIIFDVGIGHPVAAVILGSSYKGRFEDMQKLVQATIKTISL